MLQPAPPNPNAPNTSGISNSINSVGDIVKKLSSIVDNAYDGWQKRTVELEDQYAQFTATISGTFGQTQSAIKGLREEIAIATPGVVGLGGDFRDVANIQQSIAESLQTNVITLGETVTDLYAAGQAVGVSSSGVGEMVKSFQDVGIQTGNIKDNIQTTVNLARQVGVNTGAVFKLVSNNLDSINKYGFENGVAGLAKMAAQAAGLRIDMNSIFSFAEKVFDPEGAIDTVAAFQRMGVAAGDLADPFRLMYLASEDTEELQNQVVKMTQKFTYFDEKTKEFKVFPNAKRDLRSISEATGIAYNDLIKMSEGTQKLNLISKDLKIAGVDEETKQFVANVAQYNKQKGGFTVKIGRDEKLVTEINSKDIDELKESQKPVTLEDLAKSQLTEAQYSNAVQEQIRDSLAAPVAGSRAPQDLREVLRGALATGQSTAQRAVGNTRGGIAGIDQLYEKTGKGLTDLISGKGGLEEVANVFKTAGMDMGEGLKNITKAFSNFDTEASKPYISSGNKIAEAAGAAVTGLSTLADKAKSFLSGTDVTKKPSIETGNITQNNQKIEFNPLEHKGTIDIKVTTPNGNTQSLTDAQITEIFKNESFRKELERIISESKMNTNYGTVPNKI